MSNKGDKAGCCESLAALMKPSFFKALCDPNRIALLAGLSRSDEPQTVQDIACCCNVDLSVVSRHLAKLKEAGILEAEKKGKEVHYSIKAPEVIQTLRAIANSLEACCKPTKRRKKS